MILMLVLAVIFYTLFITFVSRAAGKMDDGLSGFLFNAIGAIAPLVAFGVMKASHAKGMLTTSKSGIVFSVLAGLSIGIFTLIVMRIFQKGSLGYVMPIIYGGAIALSSIAGWVFFSASINLLQVAGLILVIVGIVLVAISKTA